MRTITRIKYKRDGEKLITDKFVLNGDVGVVQILEHDDDAFVAYIYQGRTCIEVLGDPVLFRLKNRVRKTLKKLGVVLDNEIRQGKILPQ